MGSWGWLTIVWLRQESKLILYFLRSWGWLTIVWLRRTYCHFWKSKFLRMINYRMIKTLYVRIVFCLSFLRMINYRMIKTDSVDIDLTIRSWGWLTIVWLRQYHVSKWRILRSWGWLTIVWLRRKKKCILFVNGFLRMINYRMIKTSRSITSSSNSSWGWLTIVWLRQVDYKNGEITVPEDD